MARDSRSASQVAMIIGAAAASIAITFLAAACAAGPVPPRPKEVLFRATLLDNKASLDRGVLSYTPLSHIKTATVSQFKVVVTDVGRGPQTASIIRFHGMQVFQEDVPTGAIVGIRAVICDNLTCQGESTTRQPVLAPGQRATWYWQITGRKPGRAEIVLRTDTYFLNSSVSLISRIVYVYGRVHATAAFNQQQTGRKIANVTKTGINLIETIGSVAGAILAVGSVVGWLVVRARRKPAADGHDGATTSGSQGKAAP